MSIPMRENGASLPMGSSIWFMAVYENGDVCRFVKNPTKADVSSSVTYRLIRSLNGFYEVIND